MHIVQWLTKWLFRAAFFFVFFALFAFALNNPHEVVVRFFFGTVWRTSVVMLVFVAFACGLALGSLAMVPRWWRNRPVRVQVPASGPPPLTPMVPTGGAPSPANLQLHGGGRGV